MKLYFVKRCSKCGVVKTLDGFCLNGRDSRGNRRLRPSCRSCDKVLRDKVRSTPAGRKKHNDSRCAYSRSRRKRIIARGFVSVAVQRGRIPPARDLPCEYCDEPAGEYHHHKGYEKAHQLDVIPLCAECHRLHERKMFHVEHS